MEDPQIKVILVNCFGGALNIDKVVSAFELLCKVFEFNKPIVARMKGNGSEMAKEKLYKLKYKNLHIEDDFDLAVQMAISLAGKS